MYQYPLGLLRLFSLLDGISWITLLYFSLYEKKMLGNDDAVRIPGMIHGAIFTVFFILLFICWDRYKWSIWQAAKVFVCSLIPFAPFFLEPSLKRIQEKLES